MALKVWQDILGLEIMLAVARGLEKFILVVASLVSRLDMANYTCTG